MFLVCLFLVFNVEVVYFFYYVYYICCFFDAVVNVTLNSLFYLITQIIKNLPAMWETRIQPLGEEDSLEKEMATHSSIIAWEIPWTEEPNGLQSLGSQRGRHNWMTVSLLFVNSTVYHLLLSSWYTANLLNSLTNSNSSAINHLGFLCLKSFCCCSVIPDSLWPCGLQHARPPCPQPSLRVCSNSCPLSWWCHPNISPSVVPFSSCLQSFPASGSFPMSQFFTSGGQRIRASVSASVLLMNIQDWFPLGLIGLISLQSKGLSRVFSNTIVKKHQFFGTQPS